MKRYAGITAISRFLPEEKLTNIELSEIFPEWSAEKIYEKTGILERRIAAENTMASDLATQAAVKLFDGTGISPDSVDFLLFCTQTPDYLLPSSSCLIHQRLALRSDCGALDVNMGCSGFVYSLSVAVSMIESGMVQRVLVLCADTYSKLIQPGDRSVMPLFGDAGAAVMVELVESDRPCIHGFAFGTDGNGAKNLIVHHSACKKEYSDNSVFRDNAGELRSADYLYMDGPEILQFTLQKVPALCRTVLEKSQLDLDSIDLVVLHQANRFLLEALRKKLKVKQEKFAIELELTGNTVSCTIPLALIESIRKGNLKPGMTSMLAGFGVGYSWAGCVIHSGEINAFI
jgi:3-oxoacyl-[acyl-carrier-protein] synthase-3